MTAMLEGSLTIRENSPLSLSVQQLLDCDRAVNPEYNLANQGCSGGYLNVSGPLFHYRLKYSGGHRLSIEEATNGSQSLPIHRDGSLQSYFPIEYVSE